MRHIRIYEQFATETTPDLDAPAEITAASQFEVETTDFVATSDEEEGEYVVNFINAEGEDTTIQVGFANDPEYVGDSMVGSMDMVEDSSTDGKTYTAVGYYDEIPDTGGAFQLKKVLVAEA